jgi:penicillin amidase
MVRSDTLLAVGFAAALVAVAALGPTYLGLAAPLSGEVYDAVDRPGDGERIENPYGRATVTYDDYGVPHVEADNERALYFAVGYVQARDRLFQMDLQRRLFGGNLSGAVGERALESDRFHRQMDFRGAAEASWESIRGTDAAPALRAFSDGVNRYRETGPLPPEFALLDYRPAEWTPVDSLLVGKQIAWGLSGNFADLRRATVRERLGPRADDLYPNRLGHDTPVVRGESDAAPFDPDALDATFDPALSAPAGAGDAGADPARDAPTGDLGAVYDAVAAYDHEPGVGSNNWVVSGDRTAADSPVLANDPHLPLTVPAIWYEMHLQAPGMHVRGVAFPGIPLVVIGRTEDVAWGVTNVGGDFTDVYTYETRGDQYRYRGAFRDFETTTETIPVKTDDGLREEQVTVRKTVHGPVIEREGRTVGVAWPGFAATNESLGVYRLNRASTMADAEDALRIWDVPAQNFVVATRAGETLYYPAGKYPVRRTEGEVVRGDRVFDGSAGEGEWPGYDPYGTSTWSGFVPFESIPHVDDPDYLATANQRTIDDPPFYMGTSATYADPYRGVRIYDRLDAAAAADEPMGTAFSRDLQDDVHSVAADRFVPFARSEAARAAMSPEARELATALDDWDRRMTADSRGALVYRLWVESFRNQTFGDEFRANALGESYYPKTYVLETLPADSEWFDDRQTRERETRADVAARAMNRTAERIDREGYETYGDYNRLDLDHPFAQPFLDYPERGMDGGVFTVDNFRYAEGQQAGSSWRMVVTFDGESSGVVPGGQSGVFWSDHYHDQLGLWADGEYKRLTMAAPDRDPDLVFVEGGAS